MEKLLVCYTGGEGCCKVQAYIKNSNGDDMGLHVTGDDRRIVDLHAQDVLVARIIFNTISSLLGGLGFIPGEGGENAGGGELREWKQHK